MIAHSLRADGFDASEDGTGRGIPLTVGALTDGAHMGGGSTARTPTPAGSSPLPEVAWALQERDAKGADSSTKPGHLIPVGGGFDDAIPFDTTQITSAANYSRPQPGDPSHPLAAHAHAPAIAFSCKDHGADAGEIAPTLRSMEFDGSHANGGGQVAIAFHNRQDPDVSGSVTHPLGAKDNGLGLAFDAYNQSASDVTHTLRKGWGSAADDSIPQTITAMQVRRLTPRECERLQGFPDDYTLVPVRGKPAADGPRYRALGNSMAVNCMRWIGERIDAAMASQWEAA